MRLDTLASAETPEGIALSLRSAGVFSRSGAYAVDLLTRGVVLWVAALALLPLGRFGGGVGLILWFCLEWFYPVLFELLPGGATPGASLLRNLLRAADFLPFAYGFGLASMLARADFKRLGDIAAGTRVVHVRQPKLHGALPAAEPIAPRHALSPRAQAAVIAWAGRSARITEARGAELAQLAAGVTGAGERTPPHEAARRLLSVAQWLMGNR